MKIRNLLLVILFGSLICSLVKATVFKVPDQYSTIQDAIDAAADGDVILLADGDYRGPIEIVYKSFTIMSANGPGNCFVNFLCGGIVRDIQEGHLLIKGITFQYSQNDGYDEDAFNITNARVNFQDCVITKNRLASLFGTGNFLYIYNNSQVKLMDCKICDNETDESGFNSATLFRVSLKSSLFLEKCEVNDNRFIPPVTVTSWSDLQIKDCIFQNNISRSSIITTIESTGSITGSVFDSNDVSSDKAVISVFDTDNFTIGGSNHHGNSFTNNCHGHVLFHGSNNKTIIDARFNSFDCLKNEQAVKPVWGFDLRDSTFSDGGLTADIYVSPQGNDDNDGSSMERPFQTLAKALEQYAYSYDHTVTIHLAEGVYSPSTNGECFPVQLHSNMQITGKDSLNTILDAEQSGVVMNASYVKNSTISGITITGGTGFYGGGLLCNYYSTPVFNNCVFTRNENTTDGIEYSGGGVTCYQFADPRFIDCSINQNVSKNGGGGVYLESSRAVFDHCEFSHNTSEKSGGAVETEGGSPVFYHCDFQQNKSIHDGGAVYSRGDSTFFNCSFTENISGSHGGAVILSGKLHELSFCYFSGNSAQTGGAAYLGNCTETVIQNSVISGNVASRSGGGVYLKYSENTHLHNNLIIFNSSEKSGGGVGSSDSYPIVTQCTIAYNASGFGGGFSHEYNGHATLPDPELKNSIVYFNYPDGLYSEFVELDVQYSDIQSGYSGYGNINENPLFVDPYQGNMLLSHVVCGQDRNSPCIDAGHIAADDMEFMIFGSKHTMSEFSTRTDSHPDLSDVDMGYHLPGTTYMDTPATNIAMESCIEPEESCTVSLKLFNPDEMIENTAVFCVLELNEELYFWPGFTSDMQYQTLDILPGMTLIDVIPEFQWNGSPTGSEISCTVYAAMLSSDFKTVFGEINVHEAVFR